MENRSRMTKRNCTSKRRVQSRIGKPFLSVFLIVTMVFSMVLSMAPAFATGSIMVNGEPKENEQFSVDINTNDEELFLSITPSGITLVSGGNGLTEEGNIIVQGNNEHLIFTAEANEYTLSLKDISGTQIGDSVIFSVAKAIETNEGKPEKIEDSEEIIKSDIGIQALGDELSTMGTGDTWTITYYEADGTTEWDTEIVDDGTVANGPSKGNPTGTGYFIGWYENIGDTSPVDLQTLIVSSNLNLYSKFSTSSGIVQFRDIFGNIISGSTQEVTTVADIIIPLKSAIGLSSGQELEYWYDANGSSNVNYLGQPPTTPVIGIVTLLPKVQGMLTVSFNSQGGTPTNPLNGKENEAAPQPATNPKKSGYDFKFWSLVSGNIGDTNVEDYYTSGPSGTVPLLTSNITLHAVWEVSLNVGFNLLYYTSDYATYRLPEDRTNWSPRTTVTVNPEDYLPVGTTLTNAQIEELAIKYQSIAAVQYPTIRVYIYYENSTQNRPYQGEALNSEGTTTIMVYFTPILYEIEFDLSEYSAASIVYNGLTYNGTNNYSMQVNARMYLNSGTNPLAYEQWPLDAEIRNGERGAIISHPGKVVIGWEVVYPNTGTRINPFYPQIPDPIAPTYDNLHSVYILKPIWLDESLAILLHSYQYSPVSYLNWLKIHNNEYYAANIVDMSFDDYEDYLYHPSKPTEYRAIA